MFVEELSFQVEVGAFEGFEVRASLSNAESCDPKALNWFSERGFLCTSMDGSMIWIVIKLWNGFEIRSGIYATELIYSVVTNSTPGLLFLPPHSRLWVELLNIQ